MPHTAQSITAESPRIAKKKISHSGIVWGIIAGCIVFFTLWMRVWQLGDIPGLHGDEAWYGVQASKLLRQEPVTWRTPNGSPVNPFFFIPVLALSSSFAPGAVLLRTIAVFFGIVALFVNFLLARRTFGTATASATTLLLAAMPENISTSRFGWDPCQSLFVDCVSLYAALLVVREPARSVRWAILSAGFLVVGILIHPTNILTALFLAAGIGVRWWHRLRYWFEPRAATFPRLIAAYTGVALLVSAAAAWRWKDLAPYIYIFAHTDSALVFPLFYWRMLNGITAYRMIAGSCQPYNTPGAVLWTATIGTGLLFIPALIQTGRAFNPRFRFDLVDRIVYIGWLAQLAVFVVVGGTPALMPDWQRYGHCLIVPAILVVCRAWITTTAQRPLLRRVAAALALAAAGAMATSFYVCYFSYFERTGGDATNLSFHTATIDPKVSAAHLLETKSTPTMPILLVTSSYWMYQSLAYLLCRNSSVVITQKTAYDDPATQIAFANAARNGALWFAEYDGSAQLQTIHSLLTAVDATSTDQVFADYAGRPLLHLIHVTGIRSAA